MSFAATFLSQEKSFFQEVKVEIFIIDVFFLLFAFHFAPALVMSSCEQKRKTRNIRDHPHMTSPFFRGREGSTIEKKLMTGAY